MLSSKHCSIIPKSSLKEGRLVLEVVPQLWEGWFRGRREKSQMGQICLWCQCIVQSSPTSLVFSQCLQILRTTPHPHPSWPFHCQCCRLSPGLSCHTQSYSLLLTHRREPCYIFNAMAWPQELRIKIYCTCLLAQKNKTSSGSRCWMLADLIACAYWLDSPFVGFSLCYCNLCVNICRQDWSSMIHIRSV